MRFALAEVKKRVSHHNGEALVTPYLLRPRELVAELEALIQLYDALVGQPQSSFVEERPAELIGDYRLARCLKACLAEWYEWHAPEWPGSASPEESATLAAAGICSPTYLRLALYDSANETHGGYLAEADRELALDSFSSSLAIARATLDVLLRLDDLGNARLVRTTKERPTATELALRYNQRAVETFLSNASHIEWILPATMTDGTGGGLGTVLKRICFLARQMGIRYDVAFAGNEPHRQSSNTQPFREVPSWQVRSEGDDLPTLDGYGLPLSIILYGPPEVTGAPSQYGERLARLARALLGYRRATGTGAAALSGQGFYGTAQIYLYGRPMLFLLDARLLTLLGLEPAKERNITEDIVFDSSLERDLHADFAALASAGEARGWRLEREPEPVLADDTILVPDFALTRGNRRVYLEVAGYWRPGYRERKARKLHGLRQKVAMIVAAPESSRAEFASLGEDFPFLWYTNHPSAQAVLDLLERDFNDLQERLATLNAPRIRQEVQSRRHIPLRESLVLLHVYTRNELAVALTQIQQVLQPQDPREQGNKQDTRDTDEWPGLTWLEGIGLCSTDWSHTLFAKVCGWVVNAPEQRLELASLCTLIHTAEPDLAEMAGPEVELLAQMAGCSIARSTIFTIEVLAPGVMPAPDNPAQLPARMLPTQPHRAVRRKQSRAQYETPSFFLVEPERDGQ